MDNNRDKVSIHLLIYRVNVFSIIFNKQWYASRQLAKQALIHMVSYGIFRRCYNTWVIEAANDWIKNKNIKLVGFDDDKITAGNHGRRQGKGFAYSNLVLCASNLIADRI